MADISTISSAQQNQVFQGIAPILSRLSQFGTGTGAFGPGGNLQGQPLFNIPQFPQLSAQNLLPTQNFFQNVAPEIRQGWDFESGIARENLFQQLGSKGQMGSARGGLSGAAGAALGSFEANRASQFGEQAFRMAQPGLQMGFQQEANRLGTLQGQAFQQAQMPFSVLPGLLSPSLPTNAVTPEGPSSSDQLLQAGLMAALLFGG